MSLLTSLPPRRAATRAERGVAAVEFAIMLSLLVTILLGASEFGRAMYQYDTLVKNTRSAARYLSQFAPGDTVAQGQAANLAVYGQTAGGGQALVPGLTVAKVSICDASNCANAKQQPFPPTGTVLGHVNLVTVTITGVQFQSLATWILPNITFDAIHATMPQGI